MRRRMATERGCYLEYHGANGHLLVFEETLRQRGGVWVTSGNGRRPLADDITAPSPCHLSLKGLDYQITFAGTFPRPPVDPTRVIKR